MPAMWLNEVQRHPTSFPAVSVALALGVPIGVLVAILLAQAPLVWTFLLFVAVLAFVPAFVVREPGLYWLSLFLLASIVDIKKTLLDGLEVMDTLGLIAVTPTSQLVPEIRLSDLVLGLLLLSWMVRLARHRASLHVPRFSLIFVAFLIWSAISSLQAEHPYLGFVEWTNQARYFVIFLYAVNNIKGQRMLTVIGCVLLAVLAVQASATGTRYVFGFGLVAAGAFGRADAVDTSEHLNVVRGGGGKRAFGTVPSPRGTAGHLLLLLPWAPLVALHYRRRWLSVLCLALFAAGTVALILTYSRAALIGYVVGVVIGSLLFVRWGYISRRGFALCILAAALTGVAAGPLAVSFINKRPDNVRVRLAQFRTTFDMIKDNLIMGVGPNNSASTQRRYKRDGTSGAAVTDATKVSDMHPIHSQHLMNLAETGLVGFALYMGFFFVVFRRANQLTHSPVMLTRLAGGGLLIGGIALAVQFLADPIFEHSIFALLWFLCGVVWMLGEPRELSTRTQAVV
jgi:O-antigen ligase